MFGAWRVVCHTFLSIRLFGEIWISQRPQESYQRGRAEQPLGPQSRASELHGSAAICAPFFPRLFGRWLRKSALKIVRPPSGVLTLLGQVGLSPATGPVMPYRRSREAWRLRKVES